MPRNFNEPRVNPSVLDRLLDDDPGSSHDPVAPRGEGLRLLKQSVIRDLEWLLNTRQVADGVPEGLKEVSQSLAAYGLPDFTTYSVRNPENLERMRLALEDAISAFEPRLENVIVTIGSMREPEHLMHFQIDASLKVEPVPEPVTFDTALQLGSGRYVVRGK